MTDPILLGLLLAATALLIAGWLYWVCGAVALGCGVHVLVLGLLLAGDVESLGQPKPLWLELPWCKAEDTVRVRFAQAVEPTAILLLVETPCGPRWWSLPWTLGDAQQLQDAQRGAKAAAGKGRPGPLRMRLNGSSQDPREPKFWPEPQPAPPPKEEPE